MIQAFMCGCMYNLCPCLLDLLQRSDGIIDDLPGFSELPELQVTDGVGRVKVGRVGAWNLGILRSRRHFQLGMGITDVLDSLFPGNLPGICEVAPVEHTRAGWEIHGEQVGLGNVPNVDNVGGNRQDAAIHNDVD